MKQSRITPEVIRLSKEIAEHYRMEIYVGCWTVINERKFLVDNKMWLEWLNAIAVQTEWFPIPDIADCLEKLRELGDWRISSITEKRFSSGNGQFNVVFRNKMDDDYITGEASTLHEALLSALLEVVKK